MKKSIIFFSGFMAFVIFVPSIWGGGSNSVKTYKYTIINKTASKIWVRLSSEEHGYVSGYIRSGVPGKWNVTVQFKPEYIEVSEQNWPYRKLGQKLTGYDCAEIVISAKLESQYSESPLKLSEKDMPCP